MPGLGKMMLETFGGEVAEKFQCCAAFEHALPFGQKALEFCESACKSDPLGWVMIM